MEAQHTARSQRARERRDHALRLEIQRRARAVGLRGHHQIEVGACAAAARDHLVEKEPVVVTKRPPSGAERRALTFAWKVAKHVKSNAIVYARGERTIGVGAGQMSRVDSARIAA